MRVHLFPSRTQKLSSSAPTILGGRLPGKIGNANTDLHSKGWRFFMPAVTNSHGIARSAATRQSPGRSSLYGNRWVHLFPAAVPKISCSLFTHEILTAATRLGRFIRRRRRSHRSPSRTQKLSSSATTLLGGRLPGKIGNANTNPPLETVEGFFISAIR